MRKKNCTENIMESQDLVGFKEFCDETNNLRAERKFGK